MEKITIQHDTELNELSISKDGKSKRLEVRDLYAVEKVLDFLQIPYKEELGNLLDESEQIMQQYREDSLYKLGYEAGKKSMMDKIESQYERGKPVEANGRLYWFKNELKNLMNIIDDLELEKEVN